VEAVILAMSVGLCAWTANTVINHGQAIAAQANQISVNSGRIANLETYGSRSFGAHESEDNRRIEDIKARIDKVETAVIVLQTAPAKLEAIAARLESLSQGQNRIENQMQDHFKQNTK
jgi:hypothetical protein